MREPSQFALQAEERPALPPGDCERVSGYAVMGLPFRSGHILGLRRWTASSVGDTFTSIWHRSPSGRWTFYESALSEIACSRYFGAAVHQTLVTPISLHWEGPRRLRVHLSDYPLNWTIEISSTLMTRAMSTLGSALPLAMWRSRPVLQAIGFMAGHALGLGKVKLTGLTANGQHFDANPLRVWYVNDSHATVEGRDLGPVGSLAEQACMADFHIPQRGIFAVGRVFVTNPMDPAAT